MIQNSTPVWAQTAIFPNSEKKIGPIKPFGYMMYMAFLLLLLPWPCISLSNGERYLR